MLKRDFIMVQIEEISKMIVQLVLNRNDGNDGNNGNDKNPAQSEDLLSTIYRSLKTDTAYLLAHSPEEIREYLAGNLCRCTGYAGQLRAVEKYLRESRG